MSSPINDILKLLEENNIGTFNEDIFISKEPNEPHNTVTLYDTGGADPNPKWNIDNPTIMIRVRNSSYITGYDKCEEIKNTLLGLPKQDINGMSYIGIWMQGDINFIEYDENNRAIFTMNYRITREPTNSGNRKQL